MRIDGKFCCSFVANVVRYLYTKNYQNIMWFDKVIAKIKKVHFWPHSVQAFRIGKIWATLEVLAPIPEVAGKPLAKGRL